MRTAWLTLRADLRLRWRAMLGMILLTGLVSGAVLTAAAGARRTDTAYPRLLDWAHASQVLIVPGEQGLRAGPGATGRTGFYAAVRRLPQVAALSSTALLALAVLVPHHPLDTNADTAASVRDTPAVLGALLALLAAGTLSHVLLTSVRRRRRDFAVLGVLGLVRAQVLAVITWQGLTVAVTALLAGIPLGLLAGRWAWVLFAGEAGVRPGPTIPVPLVLLAIPLTLALAAALAVWPGRTAVRARPAAVLRAE